ncbi:MAG: hypothetical protein IKV55_01280 [Oscillospiraceae bacterium]|nr:hypothetical protein [Oscillospiraceae bacterium]
MKLTKAAAKQEQKKQNTAAIKAIAGLSAGMAVAVAGVACLAAFYCKTLMNLSYLEEGDVYEE